MRIRPLTVLPVIVAAACCVSSASADQLSPITASSTPVSPAAGSAQPPNPTFSWTVAGGETVYTVAVATTSNVDAIGQVVPPIDGREETPDGSALADPVTLARPLWAGSYWWQLESRVPAVPPAVGYAGGTAYYDTSIPIPFTVPVVIAKATFTAKHIVRAAVVAGAISYSGDVPTARWTVTIKHGSKSIAARHGTIEISQPLETTESEWTASTRKVTAGTKLTVSATITAGGITKKLPARTVVAS